MTAFDAYRIAQVLSANGFPNSDAATHADLDAAADLASAVRPASSDDRHTIRLAFDTIQEGR